mmetsp:Transcript_15629/g.51025  ORF Transcript_15629/g.51025 Transcript_15629/m.51025 type:complete len:306 (+) Transcript_15629:929-1846(+)
MGASSTALRLERDRSTRPLTCRRRCSRPSPPLEGRVGLVGGAGGAPRGAAGQADSPAASAPSAASWYPAAPPASAPPAPSRAQAPGKTVFGGSWPHAPADAPGSPLGPAPVAPVAVSSSGGAVRIRFGGESSQSVLHSLNLLASRSTSAVDRVGSTAPVPAGSPACPCFSCAAAGSNGAPTRSFLRIDWRPSAGGDGVRSSPGESSDGSPARVLALPAVAGGDDETASSFSMSIMSSTSDAPRRHCSPLKKAWCGGTLASGYVGCNCSSSGRGTTGSRLSIGQMRSRELLGSSLSRTNGLPELDS